MVPMDSPPKKRGPAKRFPRRVTTWLSIPTFERLEAVALQTERALADVVRSYIRIGLELEEHQEEARD